MISFRYHIVSIVAVLLALALGVLVGASVLDKGLVQRLKDQAENAQKVADEAQASESVFEEQMDAVDDEILPFLAAGRLEGERVIVVVASATDGAADPTLTSAERALHEVGGADVVGVLFVSSRLAGGDEDARTELAGLLGIETDDPEEVARAAATALGARLAGASQRGGGEDVLAELIEAGFLCPRGCPGMTDEVVAGVGTRDELVVVLGGDALEAEPQPEVFAVPLVEELVRRGVRIAAGESASSDHPFVEVLRSDGPAEGDRIQLVTVDDLDQPLGALALVLGLDRLVAFGEGGNYGVRPSADDGHLPGVG